MGDGAKRRRASLGNWSVAADVSVAVVAVVEVEQHRVQEGILVRGTALGKTLSAVRMVVCRCCCDAGPTVCVF